MRSLRSMVPLEFRELLHELLAHASRTDSRREVLRRICTSLLQFSACDRLTIRIDEGGRTMRCQAWLAADGSERVEAGLAPGGACDGGAGAASADPIPEPIVQAVLSGRVAAPTRSLTRGRSFWLGDTARPLLLHEESAQGAAAHTVVIGGEFPSLALIPVDVSGRTRAMLFLASRRRDFFSSDDIQVYEAIAQTLGVALAHQGAQWALRERIKELTCLYHISQLAQTPGLRLDDLLARIVALLPPAWQYPDHASARVVLDGRRYSTEPFKDGPHRQSAPVIANGRERGHVELLYSADVPDTDDGPFLKEEQRLIAAVAETIGEMVAHHEAQWALRERIKELTCLYGIAKLAGRPGISLDEFLAGMVKLLPPGWQYPDIARARITLDTRSFSTPDFEEGRERQAADIWINAVRRGSVEVAYVEQRPEADEGPFLKEERSLVDEIARQVSLTVEHWETEAEASRLQEQLRHAERLATVGQLSAGVAHELNEPLGAVLGFAELVKQGGDLPEQAARDVDRIIKATLHAREIIRKLMIFTRQMPTRKEPCDLNQIVAEGLYLLESRCTKDGIELVRRLDEPLPPVTADPSQLHQVLVNLVVNAIQAMPGGGTLTIATRQSGDSVVLSVADTGTGMSPEVQHQLFVPFFSTKEVGQGTGLGLAVVHGIVTAHGGTVSVSSEVGRGSRFELSIPVQGQGGPQKGS